MSTSRFHQMGTCLSAATLCICSSLASAQTSNVVLLESHDKTVSLSGELVAAEEGQYKISTILGVRLISINDVTCTGDACPAIERSFVAGAEARLTSKDDAMKITGKIIDIVDDQYVLENAALGTIRVGVELVDCSGAGCPSGLEFAGESSAVAVANPSVKVESKVESEKVVEVIQPEVIPEPATEATDPLYANVSFAGSDTVGLGLLPYLLDDYADTFNATAKTTFISETEALTRYLSPNGTELSSIYVNSTGSGDATDALATKATVFGMTSRPMKDAEARRLIASGTTDLRNSDFETVIAVDSLAVVINPDNPVGEISIEKLGAIYLGLIDNWSQVGGLEAPITVLSRDDGSSTRGVFENVVFDGQDLPLAQHVIFPGGDNPEMAAAVKANPFAIGYVGFSYADGLKRVDLTSECGITYSATSFSVKTEEYPLGRRLYLYNRPDNTTEEAKRFLEYVLSPDADDAIAQSNFVNFAVERKTHDSARTNTLYEGLDLQSPAQLRLAKQMKVDLSLWDRLSTTVRFKTGSSILGKKEINDIERLVNSLSETPQTTRIMVVGFTDDVGSFELNSQLSAARSKTVADVVRAMASERATNVQIDTRAFSELSPSVCNTDANGRAINRRVEIWVRK